MHGSPSTLFLGCFMMSESISKFMATLCLKLAGWLCKRNKLKIVYSGESGRDLHIVLDAASGTASCVDNSSTTVEEPEEGENNGQ